MLYACIRSLVSLPLLTCCLATAAHGQLEDNTVGVLVHEEGAQPGYTLIDCRPSTDIYLIDNDGRIINQWPSEYVPGNMAYLLDDGSLLRAGDPGPLNDTEIIEPGDGGIVERIGWDGELLWSFVYNDPEARQHHDIEPLPNAETPFSLFSICVPEPSR